MTFEREIRYYVFKRKHLSEEQETALLELIDKFNLPLTKSAVVESDWDIYEDVWCWVEHGRRKLELVTNCCAVSDDRWVIDIDATDEPCNVTVKHREYGDYYDWPEEVFDQKVKAALRAYDIQEELRFHNRSPAVSAAVRFLNKYGTGPIEYSEFDCLSKSMVVVRQISRKSIDNEDPLKPYIEK